MEDELDKLAQGIEAYGSLDYRQAFSLLLPLAEQGFAEAQCIMGDMYWLGQGTEKDMEKAMAWYHKAAQQGHANACNTLGCLYWGMVNPDEGRKWYRKAIDNGFDMYTQEWIDRFVTGDRKSDN